jgi:hypothetical protein
VVPLNADWAVERFDSPLHGAAGSQIYPLLYVADSLVPHAFYNSE